MKALILAAVLAAGCVGGIHPSSPDVYVDPSVPVDMVEPALRLWGTVGVRAHVVAERTPDAVVITADGDSAGCAQDENGGYWGGSDDRITRIIRINMSCFAAFGQSPISTIAHEFGHFLYLEHIATAPALMNPVVEPTATPVLTQADIDQFRVIWGTP